MLRNLNNQLPKPLPPYGRRAALLLAKGIQPKNDIFIFAGLNAWDKAKIFAKTHIVLCLPLNTNPFDFFWPTNGRSVLLFDTGGLNITEIEHIAFCLLCAKATIVRALLINNTLVIYRRNAA